MNVLLIQAPADAQVSLGPNFRMEPLGLEYLSASLLAAGHETRILDMDAEGVDERGLLSVLRGFPAGLAGFTVNFMNYESSIRLARVVKEESDAHVVLGGHYASGNPALAAEEAIDSVAIGEGEATILNLAASVPKGLAAVRKVRGLALKDGSSFTLTPPRPRIRDLDSLPFPDRRFFRGDQYIALPAMPVRRKDFRLMTMATSRGCAYDCGFCTNPSFWGHKFAGRSPENVLAELRAEVERLGIRQVSFVEEDINTDRRRAAALFTSMKKAGLPVKFGCETAVAHLDEELIDLMADAGCIALWVGFESGSPATLRRFRKGYDLEHARRVMARANKRDIFVGGSFVLGFPWEDRRAIGETIDFACSLNLNLNLASYLRMRKGSAWYNELADRGFFTPETGLETDVDHYFATVRTEYLTTAEVRREMIRFMFRTHVRPSYWLFTLAFLARNPSAIDAYLEIVHRAAANTLETLKGPVRRLTRAIPGTAGLGI